MKLEEDEVIDIPSSPLPNLVELIGARARVQPLFPAVEDIFAGLKILPTIKECAGIDFLDDLLTVSLQSLADCTSLDIAEVSAFYALAMAEIARITEDMKSVAGAGDNNDLEIIAKEDKE